jgi:hypothetical protein
MILCILCFSKRLILNYFKHFFISPFYLHGPSPYRPWFQHSIKIQLGKALSYIPPWSKGNDVASFAQLKEAGSLPSQEKPRYI